MNSPTMLDVYGVNKQTGIQEHLGKIDADLIMTREQKAKEIARELFGGDPDDDMSAASDAMGMFYQLQDWETRRQAKIAAQKAAYTPPPASNHTPGPWKTGPVFQKDGLAIFVADQSKPGIWNRRIDDKYGTFSREDADLIAASPDLLAALIAAEKYLTHMINQHYGKVRHDDAASHDATVLQMRAAIQKAVSV